MAETYRAQAHPDRQSAPSASMTPARFSAASRADHWPFSKLRARIKALYTLEINGLKTPSAGPPRPDARGFHKARKVHLAECRVQAQPKQAFRGFRTSTFIHQFPLLDAVTRASHAHRRSATDSALIADAASHQQPR